MVKALSMAFGALALGITSMPFTVAPWLDPHAAKVFNLCNIEKPQATPKIQPYMPVVHIATDGKLLNEAFDLFDFVLLGDNNHKDIRIMQYILSAGMIDFLKENGVRKLMLEQPLEENKSWHDFLAGKISRTKVADALGIPWDGKEGNHFSYIDSFLYATKSGIEIFFFDTQKTEMPWYFRQVHPIYDTNQISQSCGEKGENFKRSRIYNLMTRNLWILLEEKIFLRLLEYRMNDKGRYQQILNAAKGQKTVVITGSGHLLRGFPNNLAKLMQKHKMAIIHLFADKDEILSMQFIPDPFIRIDQNRAYRMWHPTMGMPMTPN